MRKPELISREIQDLDGVILRTQELITKFPGDNLLRMNVEQAERRKTLLLLELDASLVFHGQHSLKYIFEEVKEKIRLETMLEGLAAFKDLLNRSYERITANRRNNLPVYFQTVFNGSFGIQLSVPYEEKLLEQDFEKVLADTITTLSDLVSASDEQLPEVLTKDFGKDKKLINKYSLFFKKIHQNDKAIRINWRSPNTNETHEVKVEPDTAKHLHDFFTQHQKTEDTVEFYGILKGISLIRFKVEFITDIDAKKPPINAKFDEKLSEEVKDAMDKFVIATFKVYSTVNEATDEIQNTYELISIRSKDNEVK